MVHKIRCMCHGAKGQSTFARMTMSAYDPGLDMALEPIFAWARSVWDRAVKPEFLRDAWRLAINLVKAGGANDKAVVGPASAAVAAAEQIGWGVPSWHSFSRADGMILELDDVCPKQLLKFARRDSSDLEAASCTIASLIGCTPDFGPISSVLGKHVCL